MLTLLFRNTDEQCLIPRWRGLGVDLKNIQYYFTRQLESDMEFKNCIKFILLFHPLPPPAGDIAILSLTYYWLALLIF
jgi:hypothetical protein